MLGIPARTYMTEAMLSPQGALASGAPALDNLMHFVKQAGKQASKQANEQVSNHPSIIGRHALQHLRYCRHASPLWPGANKQVSKRASEAIVISTFISMSHSRQASKRASQQANNQPNGNRSDWGEYALTSTMPCACLPHLGQPRASKPTSTQASKR